MHGISHGCLSSWSRVIPFQNQNDSPPGYNNIVTAGDGGRTVRRDLCGRGELFPGVCVPALR